MLTRKKFRGIASVEAVLLLPIMLVFIVLLVHISKMMLLNLDVINHTRATAWNGSASELNKIINVVIGKKNKENYEVKVDQNYQELSGSTDFIGEMRNAGNQRYNVNGRNASALTQVLNNQQRGISVTTGSSTYNAAGGLLDKYTNKSLAFTIKNRYALVGTTLWSSKDLPIGYDNYLKNTLNSRLLFTNMFPCAKGPNNSTKSGC